MKPSIYRFLLVLTVLIGAVSCERKEEGNKLPWEWIEDDNKKEDEGGGTTGGSKAEKPRYIWIDAGANFSDFANSKENIARDLKLAKETGFTDVVVDVRPTSGDILYKSSTGTRCTWLAAWVNGAYIRVYRNAEWDYLQAFIDAGHELGLRVHAGFNTMIGGHKSSLGSQGIVFENHNLQSWAAVYNMESGFKDGISAGESEIFLNPANEEVQEYLIGLLKDLAAYKDLDGIILDRCRYAGLRTDFSQVSKEKFMEYAQIASIEWPSDILPPGTTYLTQPSTKPKYYKKWLEFRAKTIHDFIVKARTAVKGVNSKVKFGVYVGGWYDQYYDFGVNWASPDFNTSYNYPNWATAEYMNYGFADHCDHMLIGAYASPGAVYGTTEWTMQGFCSRASKKIGTACPLVCGGPDVGNWDPYDNFTQEQENQAIVNSVKACYDACGGYFLFDMIHLKWSNQWGYVKEGIDKALGK